MGFWKEFRDNLDKEMEKDKELKESVKEVKEKSSDIASSETVRKAKESVKKGAEAAKQGASVLGQGARKVGSTLGKTAERFGGTGETFDPDEDPVERKKREEERRHRLRELREESRKPPPPGLWTRFNEAGDRAVESALNSVGNALSGTWGAVKGLRSKQKFTYTPKGNVEKEKESVESEKGNVEKEEVKVKEKVEVKAKKEGSAKETKTQENAETKQSAPEPTPIEDENDIEALKARIKAQAKRGGGWAAAKAAAKKAEEEANSDQEPSAKVDQDEVVEFEEENSAQEKEALRRKQFTADGHSVVEAERGFLDKLMDRLRHSKIADKMSEVRQEMEESENEYVQTALDITDSTTYALSEVRERVWAETDTAKAMKEVRRYVPTFNEYDFVLDLQEDFIPTLITAFLRGDIETLKPLCTKAEFGRLKHLIMGRKSAGLVVESELLAVRRCEFVAGKVSDRQVVLVVTFVCQETHHIVDKAGETVEGGPDHIQTVYYVLAVKMAVIDELEPVFEASELGVHERLNSF